MYPAFAGDELPTAGAGFTTSDGDSDDDQQKQHAKFFHTETVIKFVSTASMVHVFPQSDATETQVSKRSVAAG